MSKKKMFSLVLDETTREKLELLSNNQDYKFNLSAVLRDLIEKEYMRYIKS
jgi:hypothetical protein